MLSSFPKYFIWKRKKTTDNELSKPEYFSFKNNKILRQGFFGFNKNLLGQKTNKTLKFFNFQFNFFLNFEKIKLFFFC